MSSIYRDSLEKVCFAFGTTTGFLRTCALGDHREIKWDDEIELCADSLYLELTQKSPEELFPQLQREQPHA